jgi:hypothetical protein
VNTWLVMITVGVWVLVGVALAGVILMAMRGPW